LIEPLGSNRRLVELMASVTGELIEVVRRRLREEETRLGTNVRREILLRGIEPHVWSEQLLDFYRESNAFLYESVSWSRYPLKLKMRNWIAEFLNRKFGRPVNVLVFGDGPGFDSLHLAQAGHEVTYFEVSGYGSKFAEEIFRSSQSSVRLTTDTQSYGDASFDVILCLDVLEHLPDPTQAISDFSRWLRPGGLLLVSAPFYLVTLDYSTHLKSNRRFSGDLENLFYPFGFRLFDGDPMWLPMVLQKEPVTPDSPQVGWFKRRLVGLTGGFLLLGRYTSAPYALAARLLSRPLSHWRQDLERWELREPEVNPTSRNAE
jgi:SAM-dependent methyltransferase